MELYSFKSGLGFIEPVTVPEHNVRILYGEEVHYRKVLKYESIPFFQAIDVGVIAAGSTNANPAEIVNLRLFNNEFGQIRWYPVDHMQVTMYLPSAEGKFRLKSLMVPVDEMIVKRDPCLHLTEINIWEDHTPFVSCLNYTDYALARSRIIAGGFRFKVSDKELPMDVIQGIKEGSIPCQTIICSGFA